MLYFTTLYFVCVCICLFQVTHNQLNVLDLSWLEEGSELVHEELEPLSRNMAASLQQLIDQRDKACEVLRLTHNNHSHADIDILLIMIRIYYKLRICFTKSLLKSDTSHYCLLIIRGIGCS